MNLLPSKFFNLTKFLLFGTALISTLLGNENIRKSSFDWSLVSNQKQKTEYISRQFSAWQETEEIKKKKFLRVVYFHPADKAPLKDFSKRWDAILCDFQEFYRSEMIRLGYGPLTISLEIQNGKVVLHLVRGNKNENSYTYKSGQQIRQEVFQELRQRGINPEEETILIVCGLSKTEDKKVTIYSPYYGMGANHNRGICFTADMEWLSVEGLQPDPNNITLMVKEHRDYEPFTLGRFNTVYLGGAIHELGHGLSLPHNHATEVESTLGTALMGAGNYTYRKEWREEGKGSFLTHASAIRLLVHPLFSGTTKQSKEVPSLRYKKLGVRQEDKSIKISGKLEFAIPAIAMIAYNDRENKNQRGYMVSNDYDATTWVSVISPQNEFNIQIEDLRDGNHQIRLVCVHANGATVTRRIHYLVNDGFADFDMAKKEISQILSK